MRRRFAALAMILVTSPAVAAEGLVKLERWQGTATAIRNPGPGPKLFELVAEVAWDRAAPREPGRYAIRLALPDGQTADRAIELEDKPGSRKLRVLVPALAIRNVLPGAVKVVASVVDVSTGSAVSNPLEATIADFPSPKATGATGGAFGWGRPLKGDAQGAQPLRREGPGGFRYVLVPATDDEPAFFLATTEASVGQVGELLKGYDPKAGRSDEFSIEESDQPAVSLTPSRALDALKALGKLDKSGLRYELPTRSEWLRAAKAGKESAFWWGDEPTHPEGANFLGPESALEADSTATATPVESSPTFAANPWGLAHTFGNVAEWATVPDGGFARMGGHFRTEPASPLPDVKVAGPDEMGPDAYVGFRPAFAIDEEEGERLARRALSGPAFAQLRAKLRSRPCDGRARRRRDRPGNPPRGRPQAPRPVVPGGRRGQGDIADDRPRPHRPARRARRPREAPDPAGEARGRGADVASVGPTPCRWTAPNCSSMSTAPTARTRRTPCWKPPRAPPGPSVS